MLGTETKSIFLLYVGSSQSVLDEIKKSGFAEKLK